MSAKVRWSIVGAVLAACAAFALLRHGKSPVDSLVRPADIPRPDPTKFGPRALKFTPPGLEFEEISLGQKETRTVQVENTSPRPVRVYRVIIPCPCMTGVMESETIPPGQTVNLSITFTGLPGKREYATFASLVTDENGPSKYDVPVKGKIRQDFIVEPETLLFGKLKKGGSKSLEATVRRRDGAAFSLQDIRCPRSEFALSWKPGEAGKATAFQIRAEFKAVRSGNLTEVATVVTDAPLEVSPLLTVSAEVEGDFAVDPPIAMARVGADGKPEPFEIVIRHLTGGSAQIESVREGRSLPVEFTVLEKGADHSKIRIKLSEDLPAGAPFGEFLITATGHSDEPVHLPYRIDVPPSKDPGSP